MRIEVVRYTKEKIPDVVAFEHALRKEEAFWNWEIDENYRKKVEQSFEQSVFANSISLLAYDGGRVVGRIDSSMIASHFDGSVKAYLDHQKLPPPRCGAAADAEPACRTEEGGRRYPGRTDCRQRRGPAVLPRPAKGAGEGRGDLDRYRLRQPGINGEDSKDEHADN